MKMKALGLVALLVFALVASGCIGSGGNGSKTSEEITIYTGGTSGVYFPLGSKYAEILNKNGIKAKAVTSGASVTNAKAIGEGRPRPPYCRTI